MRDYYAQKEEILYENYINLVTLKSPTTYKDEATNDVEELGEDETNFIFLDISIFEVQCKHILFLYF